MTPTTQRYETIPTPAGVIKLITIDPASTFPPDIRARERQAKIRADIARGIKAPRPNYSARAARVSTYRDPAKLRTLADATADLSKRGEAETLATERARGRQLFAGWDLASTDGHFAIFRPATADGTGPRWTEPTWCGEIGSDAWRAYGMARTLRARPAGGLSYLGWLLDPAAGRVTFEATDSDGDTSSAWGDLSDATGPDWSRTWLADEYVWPLRGITWRIGRANLTANPEPADLVFQSRDNTIRVAIAARRRP